jgi:N-methylhydantoinase B
MDPIELTIFASRVAAVCDEMGATLQRAALSPNIKDRLDFSCAVFDDQGALCAQAAHIPVHLGSMAYAMGGIVGRIRWSPGDMIIVNDPFLGGTHLPDVTLIAPLFVEGALTAFVANRAHHADIGSDTPGSMPVSRCIDEEGLVIPPTRLMHGGVVDDQRLKGIINATRNPQGSYGDLSAQISANRCGLSRLGELVSAMSRTAFRDSLTAVNDYAERLALGALREIPDGTYTFCDYLDDDGAGTRDLPLQVSLTVHDGLIRVDFTGTADQAPGNVNCPLSVAAAGVYYVFRCLMPVQTPACAGSLRPISLVVPEGCLLNARYPAAVAAGNVETSTRVVDVVMGALAGAIPDRIPAASHGSMNNVAMGGRAGHGDWDYYETIGGGMGAGPAGGGLNGVQTHMTNTRNTPIEAIEMHYPLRIRRYALWDGSGGAGRRPGGDGLIREYEFLAETAVTLLTERRRHPPWGLNGGGAGRCGENMYNDRQLPAKTAFIAQPGGRLVIKTPGGGGWGKP